MFRFNTVRLIFALVIVGQLSSTAAFADGEVDIPFEKFRSFKDRCVVALSGGFMGKPSLLYGVPTPKITWGPHSLANIFTHRLGIFVGGGPIFGATLFGHPLGEVSVYAGARFLTIEVNGHLGDRAVSRNILSQLQQAYPQLIIVAGQDQFHLQNVDLTSQDQYFSWRIDLEETADLSGSNFERAARVVAYKILKLPEKI